MNHMNGNYSGGPGVQTSAAPKTEIELLADGFAMLDHELRLLETKLEPLLLQGTPAGADGVGAPTAIQKANIAVREYCDRVTQIRDRLIL